MTASFLVNRGLFSDYYLDNRLPGQPEWDADYSSLQSRLTDLLNEKADALPTLSEAQTEEQFIRPALGILGWSYETQISFRALERDYRPDYGLFTSDDEQREARATVSSRAEPCRRPYLEKVAALGEAKYWGRPLDERRPGETRDRPRDRGRSPHFQIVDYLRDSGVRWGILTNGRLWRLYLSGSETQEILYYEADLKGVLQQGDAEDFKRFCLFFRAEAFVPDEEGQCFLDRLREESQRYATAVEDRLKERVFDSVVPALAEGFVHHRRQVKGLPVDPGDRETLDQIYDATLLLLYRLFFLLYAEARDLLAVGDASGYWPKSVQHIKREIYDTLRDGASLGSTSTDWWDDLSNLFRIINEGDSGLGVPRYNGGLFAPDGLKDPDIQPAAEFLEQHAIADRYLADALMLLTRDAAEGYGRPEFIDFRDLGVRHLGSVYEGLLEFKLQIADTHLVKATEDGKPVWKPTDDPGAADKAPGDLYLTNDKSERKATGSYYTPDYIVRYIVENTIGPQIDRFQREYELAGEIEHMGNSGVSCPTGSRGVSPDSCANERGGGAGATRVDRERPWEEILDEVLEGKPEDEAHAARELWDGLTSNGERRQFLLNQLEGAQPEHRYDPPTRVLELKVLDPAIGSGHFLVGALDYVATRLVAMLNKYENSPVFERIADDRRKIVQSLSEQDIEADVEKLTDENLLRRMVMKRCLYGVDLNPLAVELSKLSLWLHSFTAGAPLSFLDHHVKCGNSLVGVTISEVEPQLRQGIWGGAFEGLQQATRHMLDVAALSDASFEEVAESRRLYEEAREELKPFTGILDVWVSEWFGNDGAQEVLKSEPREVHRATTTTAAPTTTTTPAPGIESSRDEKDITRMVKEAIDGAEECLRGRRPFHWELEFPEVYYTRRGSKARDHRGFDAVIGNPPYDILSDKETGQDLSDLRAYVRHRKTLSLAARGKINLYELFFAKAFSLCRANARVSFIVPMAIMGDSYASRLREWWLSNHFFVRIEAFPQKDDPHRRVFFDAKLPTAVLVVAIGGSKRGRVRTHSGRAIEERSPVYEATYGELRQLDPRQLSVPLTDASGWALAVKLAQSVACTPFGTIAEVKQGEINETTMAELLSQESEGKPVVRGGNVQPYHFVDEPKQGTTKYLSVADYIEEHDESSRRPDHQTERLGFQRNAALDNYRRLIAGIIPEGRFCFDSVNYIADSAYTLRAVLAHFNSALWEWRFRLTSTNNHVNAYEIHALPIRRIFFTTPDEERSERLETVKDLYRCDSSCMPSRR